MALTYIHLDALDKKLYRVHKAMLGERSDEEVLRMEHNLQDYDTSRFRALRVAVRGTIRERKIAA